MRYPRGMWEYISRSTMKREIASLGFIWWLGMGTGLLWRAPATQTVPDAALQVWQGLGVLIVGLVGAAFGTDWISKQTTIAGPPLNTEIKTETTLTEDSATTVTSAEQKP